MGISGEGAVPNGTCPARAVVVVTKDTGMSTTMTRMMVIGMTTKTLRFIEMLLFLAQASNTKISMGQWSKRARLDGGVTPIGALHRSDFLLLGSNDFLSKAAQRLVVTVTQLSFCHVDSSLVMWHHHGDEVLIDVIGWLDLHGGHHPGHGRIALSYERHFLSIGREGCVFLCNTYDESTGKQYHP